MTGWAVLVKLRGFHEESDWLLFGVALVVVALEAWMLAESFLVLRRTYRADPAEAARLSG